MKRRLLVLCALVGLGSGSDFAAEKKLSEAEVKKAVVTYVRETWKADPEHLKIDVSPAKKGAWFAVVWPIPAQPGSQRYLEISPEGKVEKEIRGK